MKLTVYKDGFELPNAHSGKQEKRACRQVDGEREREMKTKRK